MGSGKSTVGKKTAQLLKLPFFDLDKVIEAREKKTIADLFTTAGENNFRNLETRYLTELTSGTAPCFISLGGGTICFHENLEKVKAQGLLIYLKLPATALLNRIEQSSMVRPLLQNFKGEKLLAEIELKLGQRKNYYESAHIIVNGVNLTPQALHKTIVDAHPEYSR